ncbi:MAG: hypothetical protein NVS2B16_32480 [Chloroflexota bacterium]
MSPFSVWLSWSALWMEYTTRWWALVLLPSAEHSDDLTAEERERLAMLRRRFGVEIAHRQTGVPDDPSRGARPG